MPLLLQPWGLLALLGIPALVVVHCLQQRPQTRRVSTLFLWETVPMSATSGRRWTRFDPSWLFWLQCLMVLLLTWLLCQPRFLQRQPMAAVAIVLDGSRSMQAFRPELREAVQGVIQDFSSRRLPVNWLLLDHDSGRARLYQGNDAGALLARLDAWQPNDNTRDPSAALRLARSHAGTEGNVMFLTDSAPAALPYQADWIAVGRVLDNVGLAGVSISHEDSGYRWQVAVLNRSKHPQRRRWNLRLDNGQQTPQQELELPPDGVQLLAGSWPDPCQRLELHLEADAFAADDQVAMVRPQPAPLRLQCSPALTPLGRKLEKALDNVLLLTMASNEAPADIDMLALPGATPLPAMARAGVVFLTPEPNAAPTLAAEPVITTSHPLMAGLEWHGLLVPNVPRLQASAAAQVLLWQGQTPLVFLEPLNRNTPGSCLCWNMPLEGSHLMQMGSFIVLMHRWFEQQRLEKRVAVQANLECGQALQGAFALPESDASTGPRLSLQRQNIHGQPQGERVPIIGAARVEAPGFYQLSRAGWPDAQLAVAVADPQESDFSACVSSASRRTWADQRRLQLSDEDPHWRWCVLALLALLLLSWHLVAQSARRAAQI